MDRAKNFYSTLVFILSMIFFLVLSCPGMNAHAKKNIRVGYFEKNPIIFTTEKKEVKGLAVDFLNDVALEQNWALEFIRGNFPQTLKRLMSGEIDLMVPIGYTLMRDREMDFTQSAFFETWGCLYTLHGRGIATLLDLEGKRVGQVRASLFNTVFKKMMNDLKIRCEFVEVEGYAELLNGLIAGDFHGAVGERLSILFVNREQAGRINQAVVFHPISLYVAAAEDDPKNLLASINHYIDAEKHDPDSRFNRYKNYWLSNIIVGTSPVLLSLVWVFILVLLILAGYICSRIPVVRRFLGMTEIVQHRVSSNILIVTIGFVFLLWGGDVVLQYYVIEGSISFSDAVFPIHNPRKALMRFLNIMIILAAGILISRVFSKLADQHDLTKKQEERLNLALYAANDGVWDWHLDKNEIFYDDRYYTMAGYAPREFPCLFQEWEKRVHPDDVSVVKKAAHDYILGKLDSFDQEFRFRRKSGRYFWIRAKGKIAARDKDGAPVRFIGTHSDIDQIKQAEKARDEAYKIINNSPMIAFIWKNETGWPVEFVTDNIETVLGYQAHELLSGTIQYEQLIHPEDRERIVQELLDYSLDENCDAFIHRPYRLFTKNGRIRWMDHRNYIKRNQVGEITHYHGVLLDITDRKRMEEIMVQNEKMLSLGGLAAGMAHEINNPLAGMIQTAEVMGKRLQAQPRIPANDKAALELGTSMETIEAFMDARGIPRMLTAIRESGQRVAEIVSNMLSFVQKSDAVVSSHDIGQLLDKTLELATTDYDLKKNYDFKKIEIKREYDPGLPLVPCEAAKIQQVLLNIFRNGAQAMQTAGVETPIFTIRTSLDRTRGKVCMEIRDNGPGMDEHVQKRIFEPFYSTKPVGLGTGLGLSVSYFIIVENHNGEMRVESRPGQGAHFFISLPVSIV
ncbi:MAG: PAS domain-containing protein [Thermodesulfobacteriota bacterium]